MANPTRCPAPARPCPGLGWVWDFGWVILKPWMGRAGPGRPNGKAWHGILLYIVKNDPLITVYSSDQCLGR